MDDVKAFRDALKEPEVEVVYVTEEARERVIGTVSAMLQKGQRVEITNEIKELGLEGMVRQMMTDHELKRRWIALHNRGDDDDENYSGSNAFGI
jgi:hypothetical protein